MIMLEALLGANLAAQILIARKHGANEEEILNVLRGASLKGLLPSDVNQEVQPFERKVIDLTTARDKENMNLVGQWLAVEATTATGEVLAYINSNENVSPINIALIAKFDYPFTKVYLSHAAMPAKSITLIIGHSIANMEIGVALATGLIVTALATVDTDVKAVKTAVDTVDTDVKAVKTAVDTVDTDVKAVKTSVDTVDTDVKAVKTSVDTVDTDTKKLRFGDALGEPSWITGRTRTATTIAFVTATHKITDSGNGLGVFLTGNKITVSGSTSNDGVYTITTGGVAGEIVVSEALTDEAAGNTVTIKEAVYVAPPAATPLVAHTVGVGKSGDIFGVEIDAGEANTFILYNGVEGLLDFSLAAAGHILAMLPKSMLDNVLPASTQVTIVNVGAGGAGVRYQARFLYRET